MYFSLAAVAALAGSATSTILWDGRFNTFTSSADLLLWSWSDEVGPYQYYIHGSENVTSYINLSPSYKNPADSGSTQGAKFTLDSTSYWNGQTMRRTEIIPQTTAAINAGHVFYHFSIMKSTVNPPSLMREHQICFFESHFTEIKGGLIDGASGVYDPLLRWDVNSATQWSTTWENGTWYNIAYEIDFTANTVAFWYSTGSNPLVLTVPAVSVSTSSNGEDWHLGMLELPVTGYADTTEDFYFSGVYIENGTITTSVAGPGGVVNSVSSSSVAATTTSKAASSSGTTKTMSTSVVATTKTTSTSMVATTSTAPAGNLAEWSQCGGIGWTGSGTCVAGTTCTYNNAYYSQCLA